MHHSRLAAIRDVSLNSPGAPAITKMLSTEKYGQTFLFNWYHVRGRTL